MSSKQRSLRWYHILPIALVGVPLVLFVGLITALATLRPLPDWIADLGEPLSALIMLGLPTGILFFVWVTPWLQSGDVRYHYKNAPIARYRGFRFMIVFLAICLAAISIGLGWRGVGESVWTQTARDNGFTQVAIISGMLFLLVVIGGRVYLRAVRLRMIRTTSLQAICFQCAYDLRGNPAAACPECGFDSAQHEPKSSKIHA